MACRYLYKGKWYTENQLINHPDFAMTANGNSMLSRDFINDNTGPKSHNEIGLFSVADESGIFTKFIQFKRTQLYEYNKRLNKIEAEKRRKGVTAERLKELNKQERELRLQTEGKAELGIKGLVEEIAELSMKADILAVGYYANKDIERLSKLVGTNNVDDLHEAQRIIDFYKLAGTFERGVDNPFFSQEEIFLTDEDNNLTTEYRLSEETMAKFKEWMNKAAGYQNSINKRNEELFVDTVNNDPSVKRTYGDTTFSYDTLVSNPTGLKDTDWVSMWTMDITNGIFSHNGIIPQVMFSYLTNSFEKKLAWARKIEEKIDKMNPGVQKELVKLGYSLRGGGIIGLTGASYQIFKEITKEGNETGGLIQRFVKEFFDAQSTAMNKFRDNFNIAKLYDDYATKVRAFDKAFEELKKWRRNNSIIIDVNKLPELTSSTPESEAYKKSLVDILGEKGYNEQLENQKALLRKYEAERQSTLDTILILEGKDTYDELSNKGKSDLAQWENNHNPKIGIEDYFAAKGVFSDGKKVNSFMDFNVFIPRKFSSTISVGADDKYQFTDTANETGHYSKDFAVIENNPVLSEFYDTIKEVCETVRENMPYEIQQKLPVNSVPALKKSFAEIAADNNTGILKSLFLAFRHIMEKIRLAFGVMQQSEVSYATLDPITGKSNYKINEQFLQTNSKAVRQRMSIEKAKYLQAHNSRLPDNQKVKSIKRFSVFNINAMNTDSLVLLAEYLNIDISLADIQARNLEKITRITGENVEIGKYIRDFSVHSVVQSQSFDLAKIGKYYSNLIMMYAARQEALPILEIMKKHYESIEKPKTNNMGKGIYNANHQSYERDGLRTNAIRQMDNWFERVVLDNYGGKHSGSYGRAVREIKDEEGNVKTKIPGVGRRIFSNEEKSKIKDIDKLLSKETNDEVRKKLREIKDSLGKERTATAAFDAFLSWIRTLRLGYNLSSASTNFMEGVMSNMILSSSAEYFDPKEIFYGYHVVKHSFIKNVTFGLATTGLAKRNRVLMDKFNVIMDSKNELQKSSVKTYASKFSWMNPHELNQRVEYINQSPVMIAMLRTMKIADKNGKESSVWDAFNNEGHLKDEFKTEENIKNWEELSGEGYLNFKQKLHKAIVLGHGNYDELRGMMVKSGSAGKALMMFKTWIPMQLYWRFATEQDDIQSGTIGYKGRYWSYGKGAAALHGAVIGTGLFGPIGTLVGGAIGGGLGAAFGTDSGVGLLQETIESTKTLLKKIIGMPVNLLAGRQIISGGDKAFESWVGKGEFTTQDAKNLRGNMADISMQLAFLALILVAKAMFWDDDDEADDPNRIAHNILVNRLMQLSSQGASYVNPVDMYKSTIQSNGVWQYLQDLGKEIVKVNDYIHGDDIITSGVNAGESGLANQSYKILMPGLFKDNLFGFGTQAEKVFEESPMHKYFKSDATVDREDNKRDRAKYRLELHSELNVEDFDSPKEMEKEIRRRIDAEFPTPTKLKKLGVTRDEFEAQQKEQE